MMISLLEQATVTWPSAALVQLPPQTHTHVPSMPFLCRAHQIACSQGLDISSVASGASHDWLLGYGEDDHAKKHMTWLKNQPIENSAAEDVSSPCLIPWDQNRAREQIRLLLEWADGKQDYIFRICWHKHIDGDRGTVRR